MSRRPKKLQHDPAETLAEIAYKQLESLFIQGQLPPGGFVSEPQLRAFLNVGRTPMREAIKRLEADRLLVPLARKGFYVPPIDIREYLYVLELRLPIERYAFVTAATRATDAERIALEHCISKFRRALRNNDNVSAAASDYESKQVILQATRNPYIGQVLRPLHAMGRRFWQFHVDRKEQVTLNALEIDTLKAVHAADASGAGRSIEQFFQQLREVSIRVLRNQEVLPGEVPLEYQRTAGARNI
jgi:DNA-binding GntR family transcriptional regulator